MQYACYTSFITFIFKYKYILLNLILNLISIFVEYTNLQKKILFFEKFKKM